MSPSLSTSEIFFALAATAPGALILLGLVGGLLVFIVPLFLPGPEGWQEVEKRLVYIDWGISIPAFLIGLGVLLIELQSSGLGFGYSWRYRFAISGFFFAIAGFRIRSRLFS